MRNHNGVPVGCIAMVPALVAARAVVLFVVVPLGITGLVDEDTYKYAERTIAPPDGIIMESQ